MSSSLTADISIFAIAFLFAAAAIPLAKTIGRRLRITAHPGRANLGRAADPGVRRCGNHSRGHRDARAHRTSERMVGNRRGRIVRGWINRRCDCTESASEAGMPDCRCELGCAIRIASLSPFPLAMAKPRHHDFLAGCNYQRRSTWWTGLTVWPQESGLRRQQRS